MLQLFPLDLLSHFASFLDGLHHRVLVPEQRGRVQAGQNVCTQTPAHPLMKIKNDAGARGQKKKKNQQDIKVRGLTERRTSTQASAQRTGDPALAGKAVWAVFAAQEQVLRRGRGRLDQL